MRVQITQHYEHTVTREVDESSPNWEDDLIKDLDDLIPTSMEELGWIGTYVTNTKDDEELFTVS